MKFLIFLAIFAGSELVNAWVDYVNVLYNNTIYDEWKYIRRWRNDTSVPWPHGVTSSARPVWADKHTADGGGLNTLDMRCNANAVPAKEILEVVAGTSLGFSARDNRENVPCESRGPVTAWMAKAPSGKTAETWEGDGLVWFKIYEDQPKWATEMYGSPDQPYWPTWFEWPSEGNKTLSFPIPASIPNGDYLFRIERLTFNPMGTYWMSDEPAIKPMDGISISCAQIRITGGGTATPSPLVSFPGAYGIKDPYFYDYELGSNGCNADERFTDANYTKAPWWGRTLGGSVWRG